MYCTIMCPHPQCMACEWSKAFETIGIGRAHFEANSCGQFAKDGGTTLFVLGRGIWYIGSLKPVHRIKSESWNWLWMIKVLWWRWRSTMKHMHCIHTHHASWLSFGTVHYSRLLAVFLLSFGKLTWQDTTIICKYQLLYVPFKFPYVTIWYNMFNRRVMFVY